MSYKIQNIITVINYIESNLSEKINLTCIADAVGYSKYHLHRMFTDTVGLSIHEYVKRRQLTEAAKLLVFSDKPILEISLMAGYESQQAFTKAFQQMYKTSPNEYRTDEEFYPLQLRFDLEQYVNKGKISDGMEAQIQVAAYADIPSWMDLVYMTIDGYPHLDETEYKQALEKAILEKRALILKEETTAIAVMILNYHTGSIEFFGVHPLYRKTGIAKRFLDKVMNVLLPDKEISVTTFREGDKADTGYRKAYQELGFAEAELLTEFGYPTQRFILSHNAGGDTDG